MKPRHYYQVTFTGRGVWGDVACFPTKKEALKNARAFIRASAPPRGTREQYISCFGTYVIRVTHPCWATVQVELRKLTKRGDV